MKPTIFLILFFIAINPGQATIKIDTIGTTGVDAQNYGPIWQRIVYLPSTGIYTAWIKTGMFASFYSFATQTWSGEVEVFGPQRNASGNLDVPKNPASPYYRSTFISSFINRTPRWPIFAVESIPGSTSFVMRPPDSSLMGCARAPIAFTSNNWLHLLCVDSTTQDTLLYSRSTNYGITWTRPVAICNGFLPANPTYNIAASGNSLRIVGVWTNEDSSRLWLNISEDGGTTWSGVQNIFPPPTTIGNPRPGKFGAHLLFDSADRINIVTQVWNGINQTPAEIWHWQENRNPAWTLVYRFAPSSVRAPAEPGEPFVVRPTLGTRATDGSLFVLWLNYDSLNYESSTQLARADLFVAQSQNNGITWSTPLRLTGPDNCSRLSPGIASTVEDTLYIITIVDQIAGVYEQGHGPQTTNPVCVLRVPVSDLPGVTEGNFSHPGHYSTITICPLSRRHLLPETEFYSPLGQPTKIPTVVGIYFVRDKNRNVRKVVLIP
ncbi:MAG: sialidase family protein [bacterium]